MISYEQIGQTMLARALSDDRQEFGSFFLSRLLGLRIACEDDRCLVTFEVTAALFNPQGTLHGGILAATMDISMGHLLHHELGAGTTLEMKVQYLAPVTAGRSAARAPSSGAEVESLFFNPKRSEATVSALLTRRRLGSY